jgi:hypothetical protein
MLIDRFNNWELPFIGSMVLMAAGVFLAFRMRPESKFGLDGKPPADVLSLPADVAVQQP